MDIEVSRKSLESVLNMITSFYRTEKMDNPDSVLIKGDETTEAVIGVETQLSSLVFPLITHPITKPVSFCISTKDLRTILTMLDADQQYVKFNVSGDVITVSDEYSSNRVVAAPDTTPKEKLGGADLKVVLRSNLKTLSFLFNKALNLLPVSNPEQDALYICQTPDGVLGIVAERSKALLINTNSVTMDADVVRVPSRLLMVVSALSSIDKIDLPIVILQSAESKYIEVRILERNFHFGIIDRGEMDEIIKNARNISFELPEHITVDRAQTIQTLLQLYRITVKDLEPYITIWANSLGLNLVASPKSVEGEFTKRLPAMETSFDLDDSLKFMVNPKFLLDSLKCFNGSQVTINLSYNERDPIGLSSEAEEAVSVYVAKVKI